MKFSECTVKLQVIYQYNFKVSLALLEGLSIYLHMALLFPAWTYESNGSKWLLGNRMLPAKQSKFGAVGQLIMKKYWHLNDRIPRWRLIIAKSAHLFGWVHLVFYKNDTC